MRWNSWTGLYGQNAERCSLFFKRGFSVIFTFSVHTSLLLGFSVRKRMFKKKPSHRKHVWLMEPDDGFFSPSGEFTPEVIELDVQWLYLSPFLFYSLVFFFSSIDYIQYIPYAKEGFTRHWLDLMINDWKKIGHLLAMATSPKTRITLVAARDCRSNKYDILFFRLRVYELWPPVSCSMQEVL